MFDNIILFTYLVEVGSFSKVAEMVRITQPTLSKRISALETSLGKILFIRDTRNLTLTEAGEIIYTQFKHLRKELKLTLDTINHSHKCVKKETLKVLLPMTLSEILITPYLNCYIENFPNINLEIYYHEMPTELEIEYDIILSSYKYLASKEYYTKLVRQEFGKLYCKPSYAQNFGIPIKVEALENHKCLGLIDLKTGRSVKFIKFINKFTSHEYLYNNNLSTIQFNLVKPMKQFGKINDIIFGCWEYLCEQEIKVGELIEVLPDYYIRSENFYLTTKINQSKKEEDFISFIYKCLNREWNVPIMSKLYQS